MEFGFQLLVATMMKLNGRWFPQIVNRDSGNLYPIYKSVVLGF